MQWRFIPFQHYDPYVKTALNDIAISSVQGNNDPIIWLAGWRPNCINVGYTQTVSEQVDVEKAEKRNIPIVRRQGAGGTTYLTEDGEITWGIIAPEEVFPDDLNKTYEQVCNIIVDALARLGIKAQYEPINDVVTENGKISGATARTSHGVIYVGGTLLYKVDVAEMFALLTPDEDKLQDKAIEQFEDRVSSITTEIDASFEETQQVLRSALLAEKDHYESSWTDTELKNAKNLAEKYRSRVWVFRNE